MLVLRADAALETPTASCLIKSTAYGVVSKEDRPYRCEPLIASEVFVTGLKKEREYRDSWPLKPA